MWIDLGTWNIVFPNNLKKTEALQKNNFSSSEKMIFSHLLGLLPMHDRKLRKRHIDKPFLMAKEHASRIWTFNLQVWSLPLSPLCYRNLAGILPSDSLSFPWLQRAGFSLDYVCGKSIFQALKKVFFLLNCSYDTQTIPALQGKQLIRLERNDFSALLLWNSDEPGFAKKNPALKNCFFSALLLWNSDKAGFAKKKSGS